VAVGVAQVALAGETVWLNRLKLHLKLTVARLSEIYKEIPFVVAVPTLTNTENV
jgi:hypothetical protein